MINLFGSLVMMMMMMVMAMATIVVGELSGKEFADLNETIAKIPIFDFDSKFGLVDVKESDGSSMAVVIQRKLMTGNQDDCILELRVGKDSQYIFKKASCSEKDASDKIVLKYDYMFDTTEDNRKSITEKIDSYLKKRKMTNYKIAFGAVERKGTKNDDSDWLKFKFCPKGDKKCCPLEVNIEDEKDLKKLIICHYDQTRRKRNN